MEKYFQIIKDSYTGYFNYFIKEFYTLHWDNYVYALLVISLIVWILELVSPWRKNQPIIRKDFWLDLFYMFFNFFLLNIFFLFALSEVTIALINDTLSLIGLQLASVQLFEAKELPLWASLLVFFLVSDFVQWNTHRLLHRIPFLWEVHKTHHSVKEMGFAAHFRYHWLEPVVYKTILYLPITLIGGFEIEQVFIVHFIAISIGHINHANLGWDYGPFKYIFNNPKMHIWHHSKEIPNKYGVNFGISLSLWDYLFKTNYVPYTGRDIALGFEDEDQFPDDFLNQEIAPWKKKKNSCQE